MKVEFAVFVSFEDGAVFARGVDCNVNGNEIQFDRVTVDTAKRTAGVYGKGAYISLGEELRVGGFDGAVVESRLSRTKGGVVVDAFVVDAYYQLVNTGDGVFVVKYREGE